MKPLESVQVLLWLSYCGRNAEHYLIVAHEFKQKKLAWNVRRCLTVVRSMRRHMAHARRNYSRLTWEGGEA